MKFLITLLGIIAAGCATARPPETPAGPHVAVLIYNINYGMPGADEAVDIIRRADADVVCLQETTTGWEQLLRSGLAKQYPHMLFRHSGGAGGQAILSKTPVEKKAHIPSPSGWFPAGIYLVETRIGPLQIMNVHLHPMVNEQGSFTPAAYFGTKEIRLEEIKAFFPRLAKDVPTIIAGDFNEKDSGSALAWLEDQGMTNALQEFDPYTKTWHWRTSIISVSHRLDHILYSKELRALNAEVLQLGKSDHYPVVAEFASSNRPVR